MNNNEMVSVPREWAQHYADLLEERCGYEKAEQVTAFLAKPAEQHQGEPVACNHEWTDDGEFLLVCTKCGTQENHDPKWRDMATAPRDGTLVRLLVEFTEHATEDSDAMPSPTIGANSFDHTGEDVWQFAGWSWEQDCFTQGAGEPVGWLPMLDTPHADPGEVERLETLIGDIQELRLKTEAELEEVRAQLTALRELKLPEFLKLSDEMRAAGDHAEQRAREDQCYSVPVLKAVFFEAAIQRWLDDQEEALSASAEPSTPKCKTCNGNGVIGWRRGQTAESYEEGESPCEDCDATGYAHSNGIPVPGTCTTCNGAGTLPDGEITGVGGVEFENGPIQSVKDCPACKPSAPVERDEHEGFSQACREAALAKGREIDPNALERRPDGSHVNPLVECGWWGWQARAALERNPSEDIPDFIPGNGNKAERRATELVAQLQADLTARDQENDALRQGMKGDYDLDAWLAFVEEAPILRKDAARYRWLRSRDLDAITKGGVFAGMTPDNLVLNEETLDKAIDAAMVPDYVEASPHGRLNGIPPEPCSGCGTPGWTGNCPKCIPY